MPALVGPGYFTPSGVTGEFHMYWEHSWTTGANNLTVPLQVVSSIYVKNDDDSAVPIHVTVDGHEHIIQVGEELVIPSATTVTLHNGSAGTTITHLVAEAVV